jgi:hypothetical protein
MADDRVVEPFPPSAAMLFGQDWPNQDLAARSAIAPAIAGA